jgi:group I intron endonuclease
LNKKIGKFSGVYVIENLVNHKVYIGSAVNFEIRFALHRSQLLKGKHYNKHLQSAWNKYGVKNFVFWIIEIGDPKFLLRREQFYLEMFQGYKFGMYNISLIAGSSLGLKRSQETLRKCSKAQIGNKNALGIKRSEETKQKLRDIKKGKKSGFAALGKQHSETTKRKMSVSQRERYNKQHKLLNSV